MGATSRQNSHSGIVASTSEGFAFTYLVAMESRQFVVLTDLTGNELSGFEPTIPEGMAVVGLTTIEDDLILDCYRVNYLPNEIQRGMLIRRYSQTGTLLEEGHCIADTALDNTVTMGAEFRQVGPMRMEAAMLVEDYGTNPLDYVMHVGTWPDETQVFWNLNDTLNNIYRLYGMAKNEQQEMVLAVCMDDSIVVHERLLFWACDATGLPRGEPLALALPDSQSATDVMLESLGQSFYAAYSCGNLTLPDAPLRLWLTAFTTEDILPASRHEPAPKGFEISAWPNPFNSSVNIAYYVPASAHMTLSVHDLLGRRVEMLAQETQAPGMHQIVWRPERQASGTYLIRMQSPRYSMTQKVILLK